MFEELLQSPADPEVFLDNSGGAHATFFSGQGEQFIPLFLGECGYTIHEIVSFEMFRIISLTQAGAVLVSRRIFFHMFGVHE